MENLTIIRDKDSKKRPSYAFITFKHEASVPYAIKLFEGTSLYGKRLNLKMRTGSSQQFSNDVPTQIGFNNRPPSSHNFNEILNYGNEMNQSYVPKLLSNIASIVPLQFQTVQQHLQQHVQQQHVQHQHVQQQVQQQHGVQQQLHFNNQSPVPLFTNFTADRNIAFNANVATPRNLMSMPMQYSSSYGSSHHKSSHLINHMPPQQQQHSHHSHHDRNRSLNYAPERRVNKY